MISAPLGMLSAVKLAERKGLLRRILGALILIVAAYVIVRSFGAIRAATKA